MSNKYVKIPVKGMHCRSCELLIEDRLKEIEQVKSVDISYKTGEATIHYSGDTPPLALFNQAIIDSGYKIGSSDKLPLITKNQKEYASLGVAFLFLMALYLVLKSLGLTNINLSPDLGSPSWGLIIVIGIVAGFSTCMAMVGGLSLGLSTKFVENHPKATTLEKFRPHIFFVLGRILSYALLGGALGALGTVFQFSPIANSILTLLVVIVMLIMGLQLINIFPRLSKFKLTLPKSISRTLGINQKNKEYSHGHAMIMGALTFFLPCGFTQAMQLYAISMGSFSSGALVMGLFALGTAPGLLGIGGLTSLVRGAFKEKFFKVAGLAIIFFALFNFINAYNLASLNLGGLDSSDVSQEDLIKDPNVTIENGVQIVRMTETNNGYLPNKFSIKKDTPVRWVIDAQAPFSCASVILVPKLKIQKFLSAGENIIEFTPTESGLLPFSCSMGMYTGMFNVYDDTSSNTNSVIAVAKGASPAINRSGGSCGTSSGGCGCGGNRKNQININSEPVAALKTRDAANSEEIQIIKATYSSAKYLDPAIFKVKTGIKTRLEIDVKDNGTGCGYALTIPGLNNKITPLEAGTLIVLEFTPKRPGTYDITCSMEMIRFGSIIVE